jgi:predicted PurR-regulated permease PerM
VQRISSDLAKHPSTVGLAKKLAASEDVGTIVASSAGKWLGAAADTGRSAAGTVLGLLTLLVLFPIYLYYSLSQLAHVYDVAVTHLPAAHRQRIVEILGKIHATLSSFFRGRLILLVLRFVVQLPLFLAFGVPFSAVCASFSAIASLVPVLGGIAAGAVPILLLLSVGASSGTVLAFVAALVTWELIEQYALTPAIVGRRVGLHPLTILVGTFVAGDLLGLFGMLVAIPLVAVLKILAIEFVLPEVRRQAGLPPEAGIAPAASGDAGSKPPAGPST